MLHSTVLCCLLLLLLSIVQATVTTCTQQGTQDCDQNLVIAACNGLRDAGEHVPLFCPPPPHPTSCLDLHLTNSSAPSGSYQIELSNGTVVNVYCDMEGTNCNGQGGWTRVAFVNMSQPNATCPVGLTQVQRSGLTLCSREATNLVQSSFFTTLGLSYSTVCGRVRGYQSGYTDAFQTYIPNLTIDDAYIDGVSITHGNNPRHHIWSFAIGERDNLVSSNECPCNSGSSYSPPPLVGNNYYCESGTSRAQVGVLFPEDPLWDGMQCNNLENTCCTNKNLPWFSTTLPETTNDNLELRLLFNQLRDNEAGPLDLIELYIR